MTPTVDQIKLHDVAACAVLRMIDSFKRETLSSSEQNDAIRELVDSTKLMRVSREAGLVRHNYTSLSNLTSKLCNHMDRSITNSTKLKDLFRFGSRGMNARYLQKIGFTTSDIDELDDDTDLRSSSAEAVEEEDEEEAGADTEQEDLDLKITVKAPAIAVTGVACKSVPMNPSCTKIATLKKGVSTSYCDSCREWMANIKVYGQAVGCSNPMNRVGCHGREGKTYRRIGDVVLCGSCDSASRSKNVQRSSVRASPYPRADSDEKALDEGATLLAGSLPKTSLEETVTSTTAQPQADYKHRNSDVRRQTIVMPSLPAHSSTAVPRSTTKRSIEQVEAPLSQDTSGLPRPFTDVKRQHMLQSIADEKQNTVEHRMRKNQLQKEWDKLLSLIQETVMMFFLSAGIDLAKKVDFVPIEDRDPKLASLYREILGADEWALFDLEHKGALHYHVLMSLVGCVVMNSMAMLTSTYRSSEEATKTRSIAWSKLLPLSVSILASYSAQYANVRPGHNAQDLIERSNYAWVTSIDFQQDKIDPLAHALSFGWMRSLHAHLKLIAGRSHNLGTHIQSFGNRLENALRRALSLQARLTVVGKYELCWPASRTTYLPERMSTLQDSDGRGDLLVTMSILPAIMKTSREGDSEVVCSCKAKVLCHAAPPSDLDNIPEDSKQLRNEEAARRSHVSDSSDERATPLRIATLDGASDKAGSSQFEAKLRRYGGM